MTARVLVALLLIAAACDAEPTPAAYANAEPSLRWQRVRAEVQPDGLTKALQFAVPEGKQVFALRTYPTSARETLDCFALRELVVNATETWVGADTAADSGDYCTTCQQRVSISQGYGLFVLPSGPDASRVISTVSARVGLRDCETLTPQKRGEDSPQELWVELAAWAEPAAELRLQLSVNVVVATDYGVPPAALTTLQQIWSSADIDLTIAASVAIEAPASPLVYSATDTGALQQLSRRADEALPNAHGPTLLFTPCLQRLDAISGGINEPWAMTPHLPGGFAVNDVPDQIFIAAERCEGLTPAARFADPMLLGATLAHELGHYLGLYHVAENDGRQDMLTDTSALSPNLMQATPSPTATTLSDSQIAVARRHAAFADSP